MNHILRPDAFQHLPTFWQKRYEWRYPVFKDNRKGHFTVDKTTFTTVTSIKWLSWLKSMNLSASFESINGWKSCSLNCIWWNSKIKQISVRTRRKDPLKKPKHWEMNSQIFSALLKNVVFKGWGAFWEVWSEYNWSHIELLGSKSTIRNGHR